MFKSTASKHYLLLFIIGLAVFFPSFFLHFDGDSYLTLWRFQHNTQVENIPVISNFFTDYGPQDSMFAGLYSIFGFKPFYFYIVSFILRYLAAISTYFLAQKWTKSTKAAFLGALFFMVTTTGLETTNWVFNMPSYLAIIGLNTTVMFLNSQTNFRLSNLSKIVAIFIATILIQPIRMAILPVFLFVDAINKYIFTRKYKHIIYGIIFMLIFALLFAFGNIGDSVGVKGSAIDKLSGKWAKTNNVNANTIIKSLDEKYYKVLLYPIGQVGKIVLPDIVIEKTINKINLNNLEMLLIFETMFFSSWFVLLLKLNFKKYSDLYISTGISIFWSLIVYHIFVSTTAYPLQPVELLSFAVGGHFLIFICSIIFLIKVQKEFTIQALSSIALIFLGFFLFWSRSPNSLLETTSRYLIVSGLGTAWLLAIIVKLAKNQKITISVILVIFLNMLSSYYYLAQLRQYRGYPETEKIRKEIPTISQFNSNETTLFYFETNNNDHLYHTLYFGFPVMMSYYQNVKNIWNVAYTTDWNEVRESYTTGVGLKRFGTIPTKPLKVENIYSFNLINNDLIDTTETTREKLRDIK